MKLLRPKSLLLSFFAALSVLILSSATALASGTTSSDSNSGQVRVAADGSTRYLSTETNGTAGAQLATSSARSGQAPSFLGFSFDPRNLPKGFFTDPENLITDAVNIVFIIAILLAFFYLIWAGFDWILSGGDKGKIDNARQKIINVVIGLIVVAASYAILTLVLQVLGYESLQDAMFELQQNTSFR